MGKVLATLLVCPPHLRPITTEECCENPCVPESAYNLILKATAEEPEVRGTVEDLQDHSFFDEFEDLPSIDWDHLQLGLAARDQHPWCARRVILEFQESQRAEVSFEAACIGIN